MYSEDPTAMKNSDINAYLEGNPDDKSVLMFSAYCEDFKRWDQNTKYLQEELDSISNNIHNLSIEMSKIGFFKNVWRKIVRNPLNKKDIQSQIKILENTKQKLKEYQITLVNNPPQEWKYKMAAMGNIFSTKWQTNNLG